MDRLQATVIRPVIFRVQKVCIAGDANGDGDIDWNDGALAFRDIMNIAQVQMISKIL